MAWLIGIIIVIVVLILWYVTTYNSLINLRNRVKDQWAQVDVQLKRRADLIPNLVETVKGYAKHEKTTLDEVIKARNTFVSAKTPEEEMKNSGELTQALSKLMMLTENYPDLKANENFNSLQNDLRDTEDKISTMRQFYNDTVLKYNNKVETIPSNIVASMAHFTKEAFFEATEAEKETPKVSFDE